MTNKYLLKEQLEYIQGGINGMTSIISKSFWIMNQKRVKQQILKSPDLQFNLKDLDKMKLSEIIQGIALEMFGLQRPKEVFPGSIDPFNSLSLEEKYLQYIERSNLSEEEKEELKENVRNYSVELSLNGALENILSHFDQDLFRVVQNVMGDISLDQPERLKHLRLTLDTLHKAIEENKDLQNLEAPSHIKEAALYCNQIYSNILFGLDKEHQEFIILLNKSNDLTFNYNPRREIIEKLVDGSKAQLFLEYEKLLKKKKFLNETFDKWLGTPIDFVRFYVYCESQEIFFRRHESKSSGIELLRQLYNFQEGTTKDVPSQRKTEKSKARRVYYFLPYNSTI